MYGHVIYLQKDPSNATNSSDIVRKLIEIQTDEKARKDITHITEISHFPTDRV